MALDHSQSPCPDLLPQILAAPDPAPALRQFAAVLKNPVCADELAAGLKSQADHFLRTDLARARQLASLLFDLADLSGSSLYRALGLRVRGNILMIGEYRCEEAIAAYDEATAVYQAAQQPAAAAQSQVGKVGCLYFLGRYDEAITVGDAARPVLAAHETWAALTGLLLNMAAIHRRLGQGHAALALLDEAQTICVRTGADSELPGIALNRANVLCDLGRLQSALQTGQQAEALFAARGQRIGAARAQTSQAIACFQLGRYNEALTLFDQAQTAYQADGRHTDAILVDRFAGDLLLQIGRYADVVARCRQVRARYRDHAIPYEVAQALRAEAAAYAGLGQPDAALASLAEARQLLAGNEARVAIMDLETAVILTQQGQFAAALDAAAACGQVFRAHDLRLPAAQAALTAGRAAWQLGDFAAAEAFCRQALDTGLAEDAPWLTCQAYHLAGQMAQANGRLPAALAAYDQAITQLEQLRGRLMVELRADFLGDKQAIYADAVIAHVAAAQPEAALHRVAQAKSRALMDLLAHRLELRLTPRHDEDRRLVDELAHLRERRNQLLRRAETEQDESDRAEDRAQIVQLEGRITAVWEKLLIHSADYAHDLDVLRGQAIPDPPPLDADTLLLEFFIARGELLIFLVSRESVTVRRLPEALPPLARASRLLNVNLKAAPHAAPEQAASLLVGVQSQLALLYDLLLRPFATALAGYPRLLIVPHGAALHYLPFTALFDGRSYLVERHQISYLPNAGLRCIGRSLPEPGGRTAVFGYSGNGRLPHAIPEATAVADLLGGEAFLEEKATLAQLGVSAAQAPILHLATHGDFNPANPLFSGLSLADGQLNTLDVFNLHLPGSLVTLSACQTGRSVVGGGDELLGLMRAFLYAGAASLLLSRWRIHDAAARLFMIHFYRRCLAGLNQREALRQTQMDFLSGQAGAQYRHPYYWAAFFLVSSKFVPEKRRTPG